jgi:hypothetical protein
MSARLLNGALKPRELVAWAFAVIGHGGCELGRRLVSLEDVYVSTYSVAAYSDKPLDTAGLDADVIAEAQRLATVVPSSSC